MPPKAKFTREQITQSALDIVSRKGARALTAKELGAALGMSTSPIFTVFNSMGEVWEAVKIAAMRRFEEYAHKSAHIKPVFKRFGMQMILFAKEEPNLYRLIFMSPDEKAGTFDDIYKRLGPVADECLLVLQKDYRLSAEQARALFEHVWVYTFAIGALCATGVCNFSDGQISDMLSEDFSAMMLLIKSGGLKSHRERKGGLAL